MAVGPPEGKAAPWGSSVDPGCLPWWTEVHPVHTRSCAVRGGRTRPVALTAVSPAPDTGWRLGSFTERGEMIKLPQAPAVPCAEASKTQPGSPGSWPSGGPATRGQFQKEWEQWGRLGQQ